MAGKGVHQRTRYWMNITPIGFNTTPVDCAWYLMKFQTDATGIVPTAMIMDPYADTLPLLGLFEKELMEYQLRTLYGHFNQTTNWSGPIFHDGDVRAKRKMDDTDALLLTFVSTAPVRISWAARTYVSW